MYISSGTVVRNSKTDRKQLFLHTLTTLGCEARGPQTNSFSHPVLQTSPQLSGSVHTWGGRVVHVFVRGSGHVYTSACEGRGNPAPTPALACSRLLLLSIESPEASCLHLPPLGAETSNARYHTQVLLLLFCFVFNIGSGDRTWVLVLVQQAVWLSHHSSQGP